MRNFKFISTGGIVIRRLIVMGVLIVITLEIALTIADPLGLRYLQQIGFMDRFISLQTEPHRFMPATYDLGDWHVTIGPDYLREVPDSGQGCRVAFFGDSITFGWAVNDADTFVNQLARPNVETINAAMPGYNSQHVLTAVREIDFDAGIWLMLFNDAEDIPPRTSSGPGGNPTYPGFHLLGGVSVLESYVTVVAFWMGLLPSQKAAYDMDRFWSDLDQLTQKDNLTVVTFDMDFGHEVAERYPVVLIPSYTQNVSYSDPHPNAAGHTQIAAGMEPVFDRVLTECTH